MITHMMEPTPTQIIEALPHVHYEIEALLLTPKHTPDLAETVYFWKMAHGRVLFTFFSTEKCKRFADDVLSLDFGFPAEPLYGNDPKPLLDLFNKRLFHLTYSRIQEKDEWLMDKLLSPVMRQSRKFIDYMLQLTTITIDDNERHRWRDLKNADARGLPLQQNTSNIAHYQIQIIESNRGTDR